jgi:hypothetical protein
MQRLRPLTDRLEKSGCRGACDRFEMRRGVAARWEGACERSVPVKHVKWRRPSGPCNQPPYINTPLI